MTTLTNIRERIADLAKSKVDVGWFENNIYPDTGEPVAAIAAQNEFGGAVAGPNGSVHNIPARPFMRPAMLDAKKWFEESNVNLVLYLDGQISKEVLLNDIGSLAASDVVRKIWAVHNPPLAPLTLKLRKLRETGQATRPYTTDDIRKASALTEGSSNIKPLVDTGFMVNSIGTRIVDR